MSFKEVVTYEALDLAPISHTDEDEGEGENEGDSDPLLPLHHVALPPTSRSALRPVLLVLLAAVAAGAFIVFRRHLSPAPSRLDAAHDALLRSALNATFTEEFLMDPSTVNTGFIPFSPVTFHPLLVDRPLLPTPSSKLSPACLDAWVAHGELCGDLKDHWAMHPPRFDVIWTWTNGSAAEEKMTAWRTFASSLPAREKLKRVARAWISKLKRALSGAAAVAHFREHDELRYSIRSVLTAFPPSALRTFHVVVGDTSTCLPDKLNQSGCEVLHEAQVPHWLDFKALQWNATRSVDSGLSEDAPNLKIHPHSEVFKTRVHGRDDRETRNVTSVEAARSAEWRRRSVPSFNSIAIESQLVNIEDLAPTTLNMNDDFFTLRYLSSSDVFSPLSGPVFRMQRDLLVASPSSESRVDPDGEWKSLGYSNTLLDRRFGVRSRPYVVHEGRTVNTATWREVQDVFLDELTLTGESRFRGRKPEEAQMWFLLAHYTIEKHREALLWSFLFGRADVDQDGYLDPAEKAALLSALGYDHTTDSRIISVLAPRRDTLRDFASTYTFTGIPSPLETVIEFVSADGYAHFEADPSYRRQVPWPSFDSRRSAPEEERSQVCALDLDQCFTQGWTDPLGNASVEVTFRRVAFEETRCGDCIIAALLINSSQGLEPFLPPRPPIAPSSSVSSSSPPPPLVEAIGLTSSYHTSFSLPPTSSPRERCIQLIQRYAYVIGNSASIFAAIRGPGSLRSTFAKMDLPNGRPAFLALNDDMGPMAADINPLFRAWFDRILPLKSPWEA